MIRAESVQRRTRWKVILPAITIPLTGALLYLDRLWMRGAGRWDDMPVTTAWGLIAVLNGPGFFLTPWLKLPAVHLFGETIYALGRLVGAGSYWLLVGWLIDRKLRRDVVPAVRPRWLLNSLYAVGFGVSTLFLCSALWEIHRDYIVWEHMGELLRSPRWRLIGREMLYIGGGIWGSIYAVYFGYKVLRVQRSSSRALR